MTGGNRAGPFPNLDAYRGIAMIMVMTNHAAFSAGLRGKHEMLNAFIARFDISIPVFFMVSGFLLFRPYATALMDDRPQPSIRTYVRNRAARVLPAYWAALAGVMIWFGIPIVNGAGPFDARPLGATLFYALMLQTFSASAVFHGFAEFDQAWSIGTEVAFYATLPVGATLMRRRLAGREPARQLRAILTTMGVVIVAAQLWRIGLVAVGHDHPGLAASAAFWLPAHMDFFALGMAMATWNVAARLGVPLPRLMAWLSVRPWACWAIAGALWLVVVNPLKIDIWGLFTIHANPLDLTREYVAKQFVYCFVAPLYLFPAMFGPQREGLLRRFLGSRPLSALGAISLGFYLWHKAWLSQAERWTGAQPFQGSFGKLWIITLVGGLACGTASYWLVERPVLRHRGRRDRQPAAVAVGAAT